MDKLSSLFEKSSGGKCVIGFDGFVDEVVHVVDKRTDSEHYSRIQTIRDYGERITAAQGLSCNFEYVPVQVKLGGNGPILANALLNLGSHVEYIGALGNPVNPVFENLASKGTVHSICDCAHTDAVEFQDGKIIISKLESFKDITFDQLLSQFGHDRLCDIFQSADLIGFENWTMIPGLTDLLRQFLNTIAPELKGGQLFFFDLADPQKRLEEDLLEMLNLIHRSQGKFRAVLGLNLKEARQVAKVLGGHGNMDLKALCTFIGKKLGLYALVIHPTDRACAWFEGSYTEVPGPYCEHPVLTTGAGDNFNAGLCSGLLRGGSIEEALTAGVLTSGYYVRYGKSPSKEDLLTFAASLKD